MWFSLNTAHQKPKLESKWKADRDRKKLKQQEVTMCVPYQRDKADPKRYEKAPALCFIAHDRS